METPIDLQTLSLVTDYKNEDDIERKVPLSWYSVTNLEECFQWHLENTPWFSDEVNYLLAESEAKKVGEIEFVPLTKQQKRRAKERAKKLLQQQSQEARPDITETKVMNADETEEKKEPVEEEKKL